MNKRLEDGVQKLVNDWMWTLLPGELVCKSSAYSLERRIVEFMEKYGNEEYSQTAKANQRTGY